MYCADLKLPEEHRDRTERQRQALLSVDEFVAQYNLHDIRDKMRKGVLARYLPEQFWSIEGLNDDEIAALRMEKRSTIRRCFEFPNVPKGTAYAVYSMGAIVLYVTIFLAIFRLGKIDLRSNPSGQAKFLALR